MILCIGLEGFRPVLVFTVSHPKACIKNLEPECYGRWKGCDGSRTNDSRDRVVKPVLATDKHEELAPESGCLTRRHASCFYRDNPWRHVVVGAHHKYNRNSPGWKQNRAKSMCRGTHRLHSITFTNETSLLNHEFRVFSQSVELSISLKALPNFTGLVPLKLTNLILLHS